MIIAVSERVSLVGDATVCTVPHTVVEDMKIGEGDRLLWTLRANGVLTVDVLRSECTR